jgi:hypothetical protein
MRRWPGCERHGRRRPADRDAKPDGTARTAQADLARRAGTSDRTIRRALDIAKDTGLAEATLCRFVAGETSLRLDKADVPAEYLGLELVKRHAEGSTKAQK